MQSKQIIASLFSSNLLTCFKYDGARLGWAGQAWPGLGTQKQGQDFLKKNTNNSNPLNAQIKHLSKTARSQK